MKKLPDFGLTVCKRRIRHILRSPILRPALVVLALIIYSTGVFACALLRPNSLAIPSLLSLPSLPSLLNAAELCSTLPTCLIGAFVARKYTGIKTLPSCLSPAWCAVGCGLFSALGSDALQSSLFFQTGPAWFNMAIFLPLALICAVIGNLLAHRADTDKVIDGLEWLMLVMASISAGLATTTVALTSLPMLVLFGSALAFINVYASTVLLDIMLHRTPLQKGKTTALLAVVGGALLTILFHLLVT